MAADAAASRVRSLSSPPLAARYRAAVAAASRVRSLPTSPPLAASVYENSYKILISLGTVYEKIY